MLSIRLLRVWGSLFCGPIPCAVINVEHMDRFRRYLINNDIRQAGNHQFTGSCDSSHPAPQRENVKGIDGVKERFCDCARG